MSDTAEVGAPRDPQRPPRGGRVHVNVWPGSVLVLCLAAGAVLFLWPAGSRLHRLNLDIWLMLRTWGLPDAVGPDHMEFLFNVLVFAGLVILVAWTFPRVAWRWWIVAAVTTSIMIETVQGFVLPDRNMDWVDVVSNSTGAVLGIAVLTGLQLVGKHMTRRRSVTKVIGRS